MTKSNITSSNYKVNHSTCGSKICNYDFDGYVSMASMAERIISDWKFDGLVMAEVELGSETEEYEKPAFIGMEVTGDKRFYNSHLLGNPFSKWRDTLPEEYR